MFLTPIQALASGELKLRRVLTGLSQPVYLCSPPGDFDRLFIVERGRGVQVYKWSTGALEATPFLDMAAEGFTECRSLAFDPAFASNGFIYVCGTLASTDVVVRRYTISAGDPDLANVETRRAVITTMPAVGHLGGWIGFAPDGMLHITSGDGSPTPTHDPENDSQDPNNLIGKLLRIDVRADDFPEDESRNYALPPDNPYSSGGGRPEVRCIGLRNPWRASFDRVTGDLWIGDVGQNNREEVNFIAAGDLAEKNFGWRLREGTIATPTGGVGGDRPVGNVDPIFEYGPLGGQSITGGYVYRGQGIPWLQGTYFYGDWVHDTIGSFRYAGGQVSETTDWTLALAPDVGTVRGLVSFGEDAAGELYVVSMSSGSVFQITRPYLIWLDQHFSAAELATPAVSGAAEDPDNDGLPTVWEYALGADPRAAATVTAFDYSLTPDGLATVRVSLDPSATEISLRLETSDDLLNWSSESTTVVDQSSGVFEARDDIPLAGSQHRFLRVVVTLE